MPEKEPLVRWVRAPAAIWSSLAVAGRRGVRILVCSSELGTCACFKVTLRRRLSPWVPYRRSCSLGLFLG